MNLIELENLVKGAPDEYLVKEVQQPTGKVPPFLALSEIQRRKDMRDRYMAQTNEGPKPTIAEQLTGGIGSMGGAQPPQGASVPTPSATGIPSVGAPPIASGAAPMPTPPGIPQGFAAGGLVGMADGKTVPKYNRRGYLETYWNPELQAIKRIPKNISEFHDAAVAQTVDMLEGNPSTNTYPTGTGFPTASLFGAEVKGPMAVRQMAEQQDAAQRAELASNIAASMDPPPPAPFYESAPAVSAPEFLRRRNAPVSAPAPAVSPRGYASTPGGIGSIDPNEIVSGPAGPAVRISGAGPTPAQAAVAGAPGIPNPYNVSPQELALQQYLENDENFKLPEALSYQAFIDEAMGEEQMIREEAKRQAIGAALVQLGAGLAAGDMAKGLTTAGAESRALLSEGRREASAQKALAQQFKLKGMEGAREQKLKQMDMDIKRTEGLATLVSGNRKDAQERAMQIARMQQDAAQHAASIGIQSQQLGLSRERAELEKKQGAVQFMESLIDTAVGKPPTQATLEQWAMASKFNPATAGPNPMDAYMSQRTAAAKLAAPKVEQVYGISAKNLYIDAVKPDSNTGKTKIQQGRFIVEY